MVTFLQRTFTSLVYAHAGRTKALVRTFTTLRFVHAAQLGRYEKGVEKGVKS